MQLLCFLGRQPALGLAELESRFGADSVISLPNNIAQVDTSAVVNFHGFGGVTKVASKTDEFHGTDWNRLIAHLQKSIKSYFNDHSEGKITLGLSVYGFNAQPAQINAAALSLKKSLKNSGRSVRVVPNKATTLNTAQILHNKLTATNGLELVLIRTGATTLICKTSWVQDIEVYAARDQKRPARDSKVGMLPPKLAQIILNLATEGAEPAADYTILDPFCGTGVVLQEASLMGYKTYGTDLEPRMIDYSRRNMEWLGGPQPIALEQADATTHDWRERFDYIACETYLGRPFSHQPDGETLTKVIHDVNIIHKKFLQNLARQTKPGFRMCLAVPAWHTKTGIKHLPILDRHEDLGYNRVSFVHAPTSDLIYHREGQIVGRELIILVRK